MEKNQSIAIKPDKYKEIVKKQGELITRRTKSLTLTDVMDEIIEKGLPLVK